MRACEGCRRRKIKCDAATTNAWPCAACIRLKLNCVPPTVSYDKDFTGPQTFELEPKPMDYASPETPSQHEYPRQPSIAHGMQHQMASSMPTPVSGMYQHSPYADQQAQQPMRYQSMSQPQTAPQSMGYPASQSYTQTSAPPPAMTMTPPETEPTWRSDSVSNIADALGELKIDHTAVGERQPRLGPCSHANTHSTIYHQYEENAGRNTSTGGIRVAVTGFRQDGPHRPCTPGDDAFRRASTTVL